VAAYLSPAWFDEVNDAARTSDELRSVTAGARVVIQQVVVGGPEGEVRYWMRLDDGTVMAAPGDAEQPDATVTQSYDTAVAVNRGELEVETALLDGRIRLTGDVGALLQNQSALHGVASAFGAVRDRTTYR
jgi:hypothetical protein